MLIKSRNVWLTRFAIFAVFSTLCLISIGGVVTSTASGMTVPDWPNSYGYNMFLFPISLWEGGIFYEHSHRLVASFVGFITIILAVWLQCSSRIDTLTKKLGWFALGLVIFQGVLGGLRVELVADWIGIFHAVIAQCFLVLLGVIAYRTSGLFMGMKAPKDGGAAIKSSRIFAVLSVLILIQLAMGAAMRHQHQGLAVPDFPAAYGKVWPETSDAALAEINELRNFSEQPEVSRFHIVVHMLHRFMAYFILLAATTLVIKGLASRTFQNAGFKAWLPATWCALIWGQGVLGVVTVLKNKPADIATGHVILGAIILLTASLFTAFSVSKSKSCHKVALTSGDKIPQTPQDKDPMSISSAA